MDKQTVYLIDEDQEELSTNRRMLESVFEDTPLRFDAMMPLKRLADYNKLLVKRDTVAFVIDQKLRTSGEVSYQGIDLASHLRSINTKLPIYILTNYPNDHELRGAKEPTVEDIIDKGDITYPKKAPALRFKARFLRRLDGYRDLLSQRESRFHGLLQKSLQNRLNKNEADELASLQSERLMPTQAAELEDIAKLDKTIGKLSRLLNKPRNRR
jgi:CheY-like chemotaxis protein